jgi:hypothetical protein
MMGGRSYIRVTPYTRLAHRADEIRPSQKHDMNRAMLALFCLDASQHCVDFIVKVVKHNSSPLVGLEGFPWIDHERIARILSSKIAHIHTTQSIVSANDFFKDGILRIRREEE